MTIENLCIVQARTGSTRLPGKVLLNLGGKTVLARVLERAAASRSLSEVAVATGIGAENLPIVKFCAAKAYGFSAALKTMCLTGFTSSRSLSGLKTSCASRPTARSWTPAS